MIVKKIVFYSLFLWIGNNLSAQMFSFYYNFEGEKCAIKIRNSEAPSVEIVSSNKNLFSIIRAQNGFFLINEYSSPMDTGKIEVLVSFSKKDRFLIFFWVDKLEEGVANKITFCIEKATAEERRKFTSQYKYTASVGTRTQSIFWK